MDEAQKKNIEQIFRESCQPDELFDALQVAVKNKVCDLELYKILLANPALSKDELIMFTEKIVKEFDECCFELYMWTAQIFENNFLDYSFLEKSIHYYNKAAAVNPDNYNPYLAVLDLYSYELPLPTNEKIINIINSGIEKVGKKSKIYSALANHFRKIGELDNSQRYKALAAMHAAKGQ